MRDGKIYLSEDATRRLVQKSIGHSEAPGLTLESLSDRELEIFKLIGEGHSTSDMASRLHLSVHTIDTYRRRIRLKLSIRNAAELMRTATEWIHRRAEKSTMSETPKSLPVIESCDGCGACCLVVTRPPFYHVFEDIGEEAWDRLQRQRPDLVAELHADYQARQARRRPVFRYALRLV